MTGFYLCLKTAQLGRTRDIYYDRFAARTYLGILRTMTQSTLMFEALVLLCSRSSGRVGICKGSDFDVEVVNIFLQYMIFM